MGKKRLSARRPRPHIHPRPSGVPVSGGLGEVGYRTTTPPSSTRATIHRYTLHNLPTDRKLIWAKVISDGENAGFLRRASEANHRGAGIRRKEREWAWFQGPSPLLVVICSIPKSGEGKGSDSAQLCQERAPRDTYGGRLTAASSRTNLYRSSDRSGPEGTSPRCSEGGGPQGRRSP